MVTDCEEAMMPMSSPILAKIARFLTPGFIALCLLMGLSVSSDAWAGERRALLVGSNVAPPGLVPLRYAHTDARKMRDVLVELGGIKPANATLLLDPTAGELKASLESLRSGSSGAEQVIFYYSGHANHEGLFLKGEDLPLSEVRAFLKDETTKVRVAILDSCESGAMTQVKGGKMRPGVDIQWAHEPAVQGAVLITSSTAEEASVERDDLGGSLFSHFFVSGLRGAADSNQDRKVTLEEAYTYSYEHTLARSTESRTGLQHPTYEYKITGQKQLVVSWLEMPSVMTFGNGVAGSYLVFDRARDQVVAEVNKQAGAQRKLWLPEGDYYIKKRLPSAVLVQKVALAKGANHQVRDQEMHTVPYEEDVTKGYTSAVFEPSWKYGAPYLTNTAYTLRRGEWSVGLQKAQVGLNDDVTLSFDMLGTALLTPALMAKYRLVNHEDWLLSLEAGFTQSFFGRAFYGSQRSYLGLRAGLITSWRVLPSLILSWNTHWVLDSGPDLWGFEKSDKDEKWQVEWETQAITAGTSITWVLGENHMLQLYLEGRNVVIAPDAFDENPWSWGGSFVYAYSFGIFKIAAGVGRAPFVSATKSIALSEQGLGPVLDLWWRW